MILWRTDCNHGKNTSIILYFYEIFMSTEIMYTAGFCIGIMSMTSEKLNELDKTDVLLKVDQIMEIVVNVICEQQRPRSASAHAQFNQYLKWPLP